VFVKWSPSRTAAFIHNCSQISELSLRIYAERWNLSAHVKSIRDWWTNFWRKTVRNYCLIFSFQVFWTTKKTRLKPPIRKRCPSMECLLPITPKHAKVNVDLMYTLLLFIFGFKIFACIFDRFVKFAYSTSIRGSPEKQKVNSGICQIPAFGSWSKFRWVM